MQRSQRVSADILPALSRRQARPRVSTARASRGRCLYGYRGVGGAVRGDPE